MEIERRASLGRSFLSTRGAAAIAVKDHANPSPDYQVRRAQSRSSSGSQSSPSSPWTPSSCARIPIWPDLCLIQVASADEAAAIDPKAEGIDLKPLLDLLVEQRRRAQGLPRRRPGSRDHPQPHRQEPLPAVRHPDRGDGARARRADRLLEPGRDRCSATASTRARASPTGAGGRSTSARSIMRSPTSPTSPPIFPRMVEKLRKTGRGAWLDEEMERLADPSSFAFAARGAWKRLKLPSRNPAVLGRLKALAAWRETEARSKNLPRGRIIKDDTLNEIVAPSAQDPGGPRPGSRPFRRLAEQRHRRAADGRARSGQAARSPTSCPTASRSARA